MERAMRATLTRKSQAVATPRALERQALHEFDDGRLVLEHLSGDPQAFGTLVDRYQTRLLNFINRTIGDRERAEDLVQEVFIRVFRHLHRFDQTKKFSTWIYTIASNLAKNELRNRSRNPLVLFQTIKKHWEADHRPLQFEDTTARPDDLYRKRFRSSGRAVVSSNWSGRWSASQCFLIVWNSTSGLRLRLRSSFLARFEAIV